MAKITYIPGEIANAAIDEHGNRKPVTRTHHIFDDALQMNQAEVNAELIEAIGGGGSVDLKIEEAINDLDSTKSQEAGADGLALSVTEENGKITSISGSIASNTYDAYGAASTAKSEVLATKGAVNGIASLDNSGKVPSSQLHAYVDDVLEYANQAAFPAEGESGKIYVALDTNRTYRWSGSTYVEISQSLALGDTSSTAFAGNRGVALENAVGAGGSVDTRIAAAKTEIIGGATTNGNTLKKVEDRTVTLETAVGNGGSIDSRIATAKSEIIGGATSACDTLGEAEALISSERTRAQAAEQLLQEQYDALTQSDIIVGALSASGTKNKIYRVPGTTSYSDYMWDGTQFVKMAEYDNAIDDVPTAGSNNLVKSGGVASIYGSISSQTKEVITSQTYINNFVNINIKQGQKFRIRATGSDGVFGSNRVDAYAESESNPKLVEFYVNGDAVELTAASDITTLVFYRYNGYVLGNGSVNIEVFVESDVINEHLTEINKRINDVDERATYDSHKLIDSNGVYMSDKGLYTIKDFEFVTLSNVTMACSRYVKTNGKNVTFYIKQNTGNYRIVVYQFNAYGTALGYYNPALFVKDKIVYSGNAEYVKLVVAKNTGSYVNLTSDDLANFTILCDNPEYNVKTDIAFTSIIDKSSYKIVQLSGKDILKFADGYFIVLNDAELSARILYDVVQNVATSNERYIFQPYGYNDNLEEVEALTSGYVDHCDISDIQYKYVSFYVAKQIKSGDTWALTDITLADVEKFKVQVKKNFCDFANYIQIKKNLKVDILGDSITEQGYYTSALAALGYTINNYGVSGTTISNARSNNFIGRVSSMSLDCDAVIIFGGVNDWVLGAPLGTFMTQNSDSEFYSALNDLIVVIKERFIGKPIYICTPLHSQFTLQGYDSKLEFSNDGNSIIKNKYGNGAYLVDYVNAIKDVAEMYSVEVIDLYNESGISPFIASYKTMYTQDGLHPNAAGGVLVANCIDKYIKRLKD